MKRFGGKLRTLRKQRGLSQSELGDMLGVAQSYVARLEKGKKPFVDLILKISHIFNVCTDILMKDECELKD